jgi:hypothetical protein
LGESGKKTSLKFLNFTILPTFAFPKKTVDQCDVKVGILKLPEGILPVRADIASQAEVAQLVEQLICNQ